MRKQGGSNHIHVDNDVPLCIVVAYPAAISLPFHYKEHLIHLNIS